MGISVEITEPLMEKLKILQNQRESLLKDCKAEISSRLRQMFTLSYEIGEISKLAEIDLLSDSSELCKHVRRWYGN